MLLFLQNLNHCLIHPFVGHELLYIITVRLILLQTTTNQLLQRIWNYWGLRYLYLFIGYFLNESHVALVDRKGQLTIYKLEQNNT